LTLPQRQGVSWGHALFDRMARVAAGRPGPEPAMAAKDRDLMARFPVGDSEETGEGLAAAFYADLAPAQAAAVRRAVSLMRRPGRAASPETAPCRLETTS
jgi:hypothetical protein